MTDPAVLDTYLFGGYGPEIRTASEPRDNMRQILVTGANKGIGLAIVNAVLEQRDDTCVLLGSRSVERGQAAVKSLTEQHPGRNQRLGFLELDVSNDDSVAKAASQVAGKFGAQTPPLYAVVNNAGVGFGSESLDATLQVNTFGVRRVCEAFLPLIDPREGRVVNVTSAAGPNFVAACSPERRRFFLNAHNEWPALASLIKECLAIAGDKDAFASKGLSDGSPYGLSKACANAYTLLLARENPHLRINACTPGFIETDLTRPYAESQGKEPADLGMKPPTEGTRSTVHLLFDALEGSGHYYGSDAKRSPLDRYRAPGTPAYTGD